MITYSSNFEDVILQRVFADVAKGNYVDVGASAPVADSNSYALYQKGWRGVVMEPLPYQEFWRQSRPEDILLSAAAGVPAGKLTLHVYDQAQQISSGSAETIAHHQRHGVRPTHSIEVPVMTLNSVIDQYLANKPLHLILIDVEGMEHEVLNGLDLDHHRPWVLVIEATLPGTAVAAHQAWEPYVLASGYVMAYFDGVNRFYLAQEQRSLLGRFALPPNVWDRFVTAKQIDLEAQVAELKTQLANRMN